MTTCQADLKLDFAAIQSKNDLTCANEAPLKASPQCPTQPLRTNQLNLTFADLNYRVRNGFFSKEKKNVLSNVSGDFRPGELTAIMGPSGAGKSTLMDILAGFTTSNVTGSILVNGQTRDLTAFRRTSAYIMQDDNLQSLLTVQEIMSVAANLKLDTSHSAKQEGVDVILREMGLDASRKTRTGNLSGGQKKRLAIALELISNPPIMFFDEPTSGLDSVTSRQCVGLLKSLAREGRTVVCTIHQPSAILFDMIDHLYVVAEGQCAYAGGAQNLLGFLQKLDLHCPTYHNPADFLLEIINGDYGDHLPRLIASSGNGCSQLWRGHGGSHDRRAKLPRMASSAPELAPKIPLPTTPVFYESQAKGSAYYATNSWSQLRILLWRNALRLSRDRVLTFTRLTMHFIIALLVGTIFYKIGQDAAYAIDNFNLLFFSMMFLMFSVFNATLITIPAELPILIREHFNRWYKLRSFYMANKLADLPVQVAATSTYALVVYQMSGQIPELNRLGLFVMMCVLVSLVAQTIGMILGTSLNVQNGVIFGPFAILPFMMFSGFFVHLNDAHPYLQWLFHMSFLKYGFEGVMVAIYGYDRPNMKCSKDYCHYISPKKLLKTVDMKNSEYWFSTLVLLGLYIALDLTAYFLLRLKLKQRLYR
ncbi:PREDICTED: ATP-binding cassette sub-family G member 4-like [Ceratosolen solmsi marchali]|uniref:ATP-binding cassette sub-family G member 4-like n=1 Tax=Ceratosolen solmsi marchali TaxID=326594 RepID=A0AAJ6YJ29_9HYME|nr:PREDICTED: ATP-binding cassette sub-family G member 4-like [Ceratosolen solmsi marchali]